MSTKPYGLMADLHLHRWSAFAKTLPDGMNSRLQGLLDEIARCAAEVSAAGGDELVMAGDVFHVRGSVSPMVLNSTRDALSAIRSKYGTRFTILAGNHDLEGRDSTRLSSAVTALESPYVQVFNETMIGPDRCYVPWVEKIDELKEICSNLAATVPDPGERDLILHAPIDGVIAGLPAHGLEPNWLAELGFKRVFAGHYHNHKEMCPGIDGKGGPVYSIGALAHHTWSDVGSRAGFLIVHPDRVDWRKSHLPQFLDLGKLSEHADPEDIPAIVLGNYVRVKVDASLAKEVEGARAELLAMGALEVLVQATPKSGPSEARASATVKAGASLEVSVADFIAAAAMPHAEAVRKEALSILGDVDAMGE